MNVQLVITLLVLLLMIAGFLCGKFKLGLVAMTASTVFVPDRCFDLQRGLRFFLIPTW